MKSTMSVGSLLMLAVIMILPLSNLKSQPCHTGQKRSREKWLFIGNSYAWIMLRALCIVPNPSSGNPELFLENYPDRSITLEIFSNDGKRVYSESIILAENQARLTIDAGHLAEGSYILKVSGQAGTISGKMIIIH